LILDTIVEATKIRVAQEKQVESPETVKAAALALPSDTGFPFEAALRQQDFNFICEVKKASPSKGIIAEHFPYLDIAKEYEVAGAAAISVLTEPDFFKGDKKYLQEIASTVKIPVLRKDFIIDEYQIYQAKVWGASAILLICACLDVPTLTKFRKLADSLGLSSLVEAHDEKEVQMAINCGARIIGVNNRNLKDFTVDVQNSVRLRNLVQDDVIFVSESGLETPEDIQVLRDNNIGVALMGETFMRSPNKVEKLAYLYGPTYYTPKVKMCGISKVETIPAIVDAKPYYMGLVFAPSKRQVTVEQAKTLVEELHKQYAVRYNSRTEHTAVLTSLEPTNSETETSETGEFGSTERKIVFIVGVGGLCCVPIFKSITHLPPFVGIMLVLGLLWSVTELFYRNLHRKKGDGVSFSKRVTALLSRIDMSTILFFLGILMAVACLEEIGVLMNLGKSLNVVFDGNHYAVTGIIGVLSSIVDNVPLVAGSMGMYPIQAMGDMAVDGIFWQLLAYCAGVGGSMLIIGSAAGVVVMGLEKITFGWYMKRITWVAFVGYVAGILTYWVERMLFFS